MLINNAWLTVNRECNNRCGWCYAQGVNFEKKKMSLGLVGELASFLEDIGVKNCVIIGGEPTIYPHILQVPRLLEEKGISSHLVTNGRKLKSKDFCKKVFQSGFETITLSMKGVDPEDYKKLTGVDGYSEVIEGFCNMSDLGKVVPFEVTIVQGVIDRIEELFENLLHVGVKNFSINLGGPFIDSGVISNEGISNPRVLARAVVRIHELFKKNKRR